MQGEGRAAVRSVERHLWLLRVGGKGTRPLQHVRESMGLGTMQCAIHFLHAKDKGVHDRCAGRASDK